MIPYRNETQGVVSLRLFDPAECREILGRIELLGGWTVALIRQGLEDGDYGNVTRPDERSAHILNSVHASWFYREFEQRMFKLVKPLVEQLWKLDLSSCSGTQLLKYEAAGHYRPHRDTGVDLEQRYFSVVCYLNDDFEGGRTLFPTLDYAVTPDAGRAVLFPSTYLHGSEPVIDGRKFVLVSWIDGPVPVKWI
ncbi:MAG: prolyl hydroxylase family protein [Pyrinomonadaceae bacterium]